MTDFLTLFPSKYIFVFKGPCMARASVITVGHLAAYDTFKDAFVNYIGFARTSPVTHFGAAISAATFSSIISNPLDVVKVRVLYIFFQSVYD